MFADIPIPKGQDPYDGASPQAAFATFMHTWLSYVEEDEYPVDWDGAGEPPQALALRHRAQEALAAAQLILVGVFSQPAMDAFHWLEDEQRGPCYVAQVQPTEAAPFLLVLPRHELASLTNLVAHCTYLWCKQHPVQAMPKMLFRCGYRAHTPRLFHAENPEENEGPSRRQSHFAGALGSWTQTRLEGLHCVTLELNRKGMLDLIWANELPPTEPWVGHYAAYLHQQEALAARYTAELAQLSPPALHLLHAMMGEELQSRNQCTKYTS